MYSSSVPRSPWPSAAVDLRRAARLAQCMDSFTAKDVLTVENGRHQSRLVVISESASIESAGASWAKEQAGETWLLLKSDSAPLPTPREDLKLRTSECVGLLCLEDLASFFAIFFGQQYNRGSSFGPTGLASPPPSPLSSKILSRPGETQRDDICNKITSNQPIAARLVSDLSGCNSLQHVSLDTNLTSILTLLSRSNTRCLVVSDVDHGTVCGIVTAQDVISFLMTHAEEDNDLAALFATALDDPVTTSSHDQAAVISGDKSVLDALMRMHGSNTPVLAVMDPVGGFLSPISSSEIAVEILRSSSRKILTTPLAAFVKTLRSKHPQGTDGKDTHPAVCIGMSSSLGRAASLMLATDLKGVFVLDDQRVVMTPPLSCVSVSPSRDSAFLFSADPDILPVSRSMPFPAPPSQHHRRNSNQFWTTPRSYSGASANESSLATLPSFSTAGRQMERRPSLKLDSVLTAPVQKATNVTGNVLFRRPSATAAHRPRSQSLAQSGTEELTSFRQYAQQTSFRSQHVRTPSTQTPGAGATSSSPSSPFGTVPVSGYFGDSVQSGMPRHLVTLQTVLCSVLAVLHAADKET